MQKLYLCHMQQNNHRNPNNLTEQTAIRKELRNGSTSAESTLWLSLKGRQVEGMRWRRQFGVGPYVLDFYCPQLHLCIELDGAQHTTAENASADNQRDAALSKWGITVVRYPNDRVRNNFTAVTADILEKIGLTFSDLSPL